MTKYALLLQKQVLDALPTHSRKKNSSAIARALLMLLLVGAMVAVFVFVFSRFIDTYIAIKIDRVQDIPARQYEILSLGFFVLMVVFVLSGVASLSHELFENSDLNILITMPFHGTEIFLAKLTAVYLKQVVLALICVPTLNLTFLLVADAVTVYRIIGTFIVAVFIPIIPMAVASIIVLPFYYIKKVINSHYLLSFATMTILMGLFCWGYSYVFDLAQSLFTTGKITSLFNENVMDFIIGFTKYNYPANLFASLMLGRDIDKSLGILIGISVAAAVACFFLVRAIFIRVTHKNLSFRIPHSKKKHMHFYKTSRFSALLGKELLLVLRTPSYAYMYLTTAAVMPILAYYSAQMAQNMVAGLLGDSNLSFEICTFIVILYSMLTNTFCSTNISRDGYMCMTQKTLPFSPAKILGAKITFCAVVAELSVLIACIALGATGVERWQDCAITFVAGSLYAMAQIVMATKLDLMHPHFSRTQDGEIKESNGTVSIVIIMGLLTSFLIGFGLLFSAFAPLIGGEGIVQTDKTISYIIALCAPFALLCFAIGFFFINLGKTYSNLDTED